MPESADQGAAADSVLDSREGLVEAHLLLNPPHQNYLIRDDSGHRVYLDP
jgi:hypothetical protein